MVANLIQVPKYLLQGKYKLYSRTCKTADSRTQIHDRGVPRQAVLDKRYNLTALSCR